MIKFWVNRVKSGKATLEDVPMIYRDAVREALMVFYENIC